MLCLISAIQQSNSIILGWPKILFAFSIPWYRKPIANFLVHPIHIYYFSYYFPLWFNHRILNVVLCLCSRTLLFFHPIYNCLHLLVLTSQSFPSKPLPSSWQRFCSLYFWACFCFVDKFMCVVFLIPYTSDLWYLSFSFWLTSLNMIICRSIRVAANGIISFFLMAE